MVIKYEFSFVKRIFIIDMADGDAIKIVINFFAKTILYDTG
jgi:hypothetical protein